MPIGKRVLEFPSGLAEATDANPEVAAIREVKEETGYTATVVPEPGDEWPTVFLDPWKSTERDKFVRVNVDLSAEENKNPEPKMDNEEDIKVYWLPLKGLKDELLAISEKENFEIETKLWSFATALDFSALFLQ